MLSAKQLYGSYPRWPRLVKLLVIISLFLMGFGVLIHLVEPQTFTTIYDGIWWAIVTAGTVGYGDFVPVTPIGKGVGIVLILSGAALVASYFASVATVAASSEQSFIEGKKTFKGKQQLIIVGWNERSRYIIADMHEREPQLPIVLIDESLPRHPLPRTNIHFIHGRAAEDNILLKANIHDAKQILITADLQQNEFQTDMFSILTLLAVKGLNPSVYCLVEILTEEQRQNALRAGANGLIETNKFSSFYMVKALLTGNATAFNHDDPSKRILNKALPTKTEWEGLTMKQLGHILLDNNHYFTGIIRDGQSYFQPPLDWVLGQDDSLLILDDTN